MSERCPLRLGGPTFDLPEICRDVCEELWDAAMASGVSTGYETYAKAGDVLSHTCTSDLEHAHDALFATGAFAREYVVVDQCMQHGEEYGEEGFVFSCPLPVEGQD